MTVPSNPQDNTPKTKESLRGTIQLLNQIIDILGKFRENHGKRLNFSKLMRRLNVPNSAIDEIIYLLLNFQERFEVVFNKYRLKKKRIDNQVYLITERREKDIVENLRIPRIISITPSHLQVFNDIIYAFKFIKRGKGFDVLKNGTGFLRNIKEVRQAHPYLFESKGNGMVYPSELGLKLGELVLSYNKSNKKIEYLTIENHEFLVKEDG